jgi:predicted HTH domain antitoxin
VPADVKMAAEEALIVKMEAISEGERLTLARRASGRVAAALLADAEARVVRAALENGRLTEALVAAAVGRADVPPHTIMEVCEHPKWSLRQEVRMALLRSEAVPMERAVELARGLSSEALREVLRESRLAIDVQERLLAEVGRS